MNGEQKWTSFSIQFCLHDGEEHLHCLVGTHTLGFSFESGIITCRREENKLTIRDESQIIIADSCLGAF